jgi:hypothetical protein
MCHNLFIVKLLKVNISTILTLGYNHGEEQFAHINNKTISNSDRLKNAILF